MACCVYSRTASFNVLFLKGISWSVTVAYFHADSDRGFSKKKKNKKKNKKRKRFSSSELEDEFSSDESEYGRKKS